MTLVVDASVVVAWILPDERTSELDVLLRDVMGRTALVPSIFWHEVRNTFLMAERRGRLMVGEARSSLRDVRDLGFRDAGPDDDELVIRLALQHALSAYDAAYLALAISRGVPLATIDKRLAAGARAERVELEGPLRGFG